jgi:hypothetical protein
MKKLYGFMILLAFYGTGVFGAPADTEEIDFLIFLPNSGNLFADEAQAMTDLDNVARYLKGRDISPGQIYVYGYVANVINDRDIDPIQLSINRARFVIQELQKRGIARELFAAPVGHGAVDLWGNNTDEPETSPNRRVRILLENVILTQALVNAEPIEPSESVEPVEPVAETAKKSTEKQIEKSSYYPWWKLLLLLPLLVIPPIVLSVLKRKGNAPAKPAPVIAQKVEPPKPEPAPIIEPQKAEPTPVPVQKTEPQKVEPTPVFARKTEPQKIETVPVFARKTEPQKVEPASVFARKTEPPKERIKILNEDEIRNHAYGLYENRYGLSEDSVVDWYQSICDLTAHYHALGYRVVLYWEPEAEAIR